MAAAVPVKEVLAELKAVEDAGRDIDTTLPRQAAGKPNHRIRGFPIATGRGTSRGNISVWRDPLPPSFASSGAFASVPARPARRVLVEEGSACHEVHCDRRRAFSPLLAGKGLRKAQHRSARRARRTVRGIGPPLAR